MAGLLPLAVGLEMDMVTCGSSKLFLTLDLQDNIRY